MTAADCLRRVRAKKISLDAKREREERLRAVAEGITQRFTHTSVKGITDKVGTMVPQILDYCDSIQTDAVKLITYLTMAQHAIDTIKDDDHKAAMELYYLNGETWEEIALRFGKSRQTIWRWHKMGMKDVAEYGSEYLNQLQADLEEKAVNKNGGECQSYPYCLFCEEPDKFFRKSETPCADAKIRWQENREKKKTL